MNKILQGIKAISGIIGFYSLKKEQRQVTFYSEGKNLLATSSRAY